MSRHIPVVSLWACQLALIIQKERELTPITFSTSLSVFNSAGCTFAVTFFTNIADVDIVSGTGFNTCCFLFE